eukprot:maker-scaffold414_size178625-snap-gene-0.26 protein:Tk11232 transcript:maker-scaffold414_size178625-snap-gene-0.26-mRNA-1 annotation:"rbp1-like rna-binding protein pb"
MATFKELWILKPKVYIGNLGDKAQAEELEELFSQYGPVQNMWLANEGNGFALVEYESERDALRAVKVLDGSTALPQLESREGRRRSPLNRRPFPDTRGRGTGQRGLARPIGELPDRSQAASEVPALDGGLRAYETMKSYEHRERYPPHPQPSDRPDQSLSPSHRTRIPRSPIPTSGWEEGNPPGVSRFPSLGRQSEYSRTEDRTRTRRHHSRESEEQYRRPRRSDDLGQRGPAFEETRYRSRSDHRHSALDVGVPMRADRVKRRYMDEIPPPSPSIRGSDPRDRHPPPSTERSISPRFDRSRRSDSSYCAELQSPRHKTSRLSDARAPPSSNRRYTSDRRTR